MSSFSSKNALNPDDPLYYAPPSLRNEANRRSNPAPQRRPEELHPSSSWSRSDEMREEALAKSRLHPVESQFVYDRPRSRVPLGGIVAAVGVSAIFAFVFLTWFQSPQKAGPSALVLSTPASAATADVPPPKESQALLQKFEQFKNSQGNEEPAVSQIPTLTTAERANAEPQSQALLGKFVDWSQKK